MVNLSLRENLLGSRMQIKPIAITCLSILATACTVEWVIPSDYFVECSSQDDCPDTATCVSTSDETTSICVTDGEPNCGNSVVETEEACDDGNNQDGDYCTSDCGKVTTICGDGKREDDEICDEGENNSDTYNITRHCLIDCSGYAPCCGDGIIDPTEACDNNSEDSGCTDTCERAENVVCGDFITHTSFEECDEGNAVTETCGYGSPDGCTICDANCEVQILTSTWCGDGLLQQEGQIGQSFEGCDGNQICTELGLGEGLATCEPNCFALNTEDCTTQDMVYVPAGPFLMGCNALEDFDCSSNELPQHEVFLDAFLIDRFEVTASEYAACVDAGICVYEGSTTSNLRTYGKEGREDYPINYVNWDEASAYCAWQGKTLPTEAQWEKAARGPDARKYPWGNLPEVGCDYASTQLDVPDEATCDDGGIMAVGSKPLGKSIYGAEDMIGNVWEWTQDYYDAAYYQQAPTGMWNNPQGPTISTERSLRGGGYGNSASYYFRASTRNGEESDRRVGTYGFRCAR